MLRNKRKRISWLLGIFGIIATRISTKITTGSAVLLAIIAIVMSSGLIGQENDLLKAELCGKDIGYS